MIIRFLFVLRVVMFATSAMPAAGFAAPNKKVVFIRHGCTYMNEYLGRGPSFGAPNFSDVFTDHDQLSKYRDSPLSETGIRQARALVAKPPTFLQNCELLAVSPLTRALQTLDLGLKPHLNDREIPVVALPIAAERLYLISDVGRPVSELERDFPSVDFSSAFAEFDDHDPTAWWHQPADNYVEWRPTGRGQRYACPGEPAADFDLRMQKLYTWLYNRPESNIAVVSHWGVIDWMLDMDFANCQWRQVDFADIQSRGLARQQ